jgi:hypothetical protein
LWLPYETFLSTEEGREFDKAHKAFRAPARFAAWLRGAGAHHPGAAVAAAWAEAPLLNAASYRRCEVNNRVLRIASATGRDRTLNNVVFHQLPGAKEGLWGVIDEFVVATWRGELLGLAHGLWYADAALAMDQVPDIVRIRTSGAAIHVPEEPWVLLRCVQRFGEYVLDNVARRPAASGGAYIPRRAAHDGPRYRIVWAADGWVDPRAEGDGRWSAGRATAGGDARPRNGGGDEEDEEEEEWETDGEQDVGAQEDDSF